MPNAIISLVTGPEYLDLSKLTTPSMKAYAANIGADFRVFHRSVHPRRNYLLDKPSVIRTALEAYDRVAFLDADAIVRPDAPDIFAEVPETHIGGHDENESNLEFETSTHEYLKQLGVDNPVVSYHINTGVLVVSRCHLEALQDPPHWGNAGRTAEQSWLCYRFTKLGTPIHKLAPEWNWMPISMSEYPYQKRVNIIHYAGVGTGLRLVMLKRDLAIWWKEGFVAQ